MTKPYNSKNLDLGSAIKTVTGIDPVFHFDEHGIVTLEFPMTQAVADVVMRYESGIQVDARTILTVRNQLYKRIRGGGR